MNSPFSGGGWQNIDCCKLCPWSLGRGRICSTGHHHTLEHGHHVCSGGLLPGEGHHELPSSGRAPECVDSAVPSTPGVAAPSRVDSIDSVDSVDSIPPAVSC